MQGQRLAVDANLHVGADFDLMAGMSGLDEPRPTGRHRGRDDLYRCRLRPFRP